MTAHAYLDKFSVLGQSIYLEGWASDFNLELFYDNERVPLCVQPVDRPDLVSVFGDGSERWGFVACGILPSRNIDRAKFRLRFNTDIEHTSPQDHFSDAADEAFAAMIIAFQNEVKTRRGSLLEIGSRARSGATYRSWFPDVEEYVGLDVTNGPNVNIVGDAHHMSEFIEKKFDFVFSIAVFEHILMPWKVAIEMNRVMADGGMGLIISHGGWPLHEEPWDFWRYSKEAWQGIFNIHTGFEIVDARYQHPASIVPFWIHTEDFLVMSQGSTYLLSGCLIRKIGPCKVAWNENVSDVYDLAYSHRNTEETSENENKSNGSGRVDDFNPEPHTQRKTEKPMPDHQPGVISTFEIEGKAIKLFVKDPAEEIQKYHYAGSFYEAEELELIRKHYKKGTIFADIGANIGNHAIFAEKILEAPEVIVFEPNPAAISYMKINFMLNECKKINSDYLGFPVSDRMGQSMAIKLSPANNLGNTVFGKSSQGEFHTITGDFALSQRPVGFVKIDTEGMEFQTLNGLEKTLAV